MSGFDLRLYNYPAERLFNPRKRLAGVIIPKEIIKLVPLKEVSSKKIEQDSDCIRFLEFFNDPMFDNLSDIRTYFQNKENSSLLSEVTDTKTERMLTTALMYLFLHKRFLQILTADDTIFSYHLPFLAEAVFDIECSFYLMKGGYFKQSLQTLRNAIELTLLHAYFGLKFLDENELDEAINKRYPNLKEVIIFLRTENLLTNRLEQEYFQQYQILSRAVHSEISKLTVSRSFEYKETFSEWYDSFSHVASLNIRTMIRMIEIGI